MRLNGKETSVLQRWGSAFHQDTFLLYATFEEAIAETVGSLDADEKDQLLRLVDRLLAGCTNSELKGHFSRSGAQWFVNSQGARGVFEVTRDTLRKRNSA